MDYGIVAQVITMVIAVLVAFWAGGTALLNKIREKLEELADLSVAQERFFRTAAEALADGKLTAEEVADIVSIASDWWTRLQRLIGVIKANEMHAQTAKVKRMPPEYAISVALLKVKEVGR